MEKLNGRSAWVFGVAALMLCRAVMAAPMPTDTAAAPDARSARIADLMNLSRVELQQIAPIDAREKTLRVPVTLDGDAHRLWLEPFSLRADDFKVFESDAPGQMTEVVAPAPCTWRGVVEGVPGSRVAGSVIDGQLQATIVFDDGSLWAVQPVNKTLPREAPTLHAAYRHSDVLDDGHRCGVPDDAESAVPGPPIVHEDGGIAGTTLYDTQIAFDADFPFYQLNGSNTAATIADIENVMASVEAIYSNQVSITYTITAVVVRTSAAGDPYSSSNADTLLCQFRSHWNGAQAGITRDVAHLMTGREIDGTTIGIAWIGVVCDGTIYNECGLNATIAYGLSQSRWSGAMSARAALTAHELGHNWNAEHCNSEGGCGIMCSSLGGCSGSLTTFGTTPTNAIIAWRNQAGCLSPTNVVPGPFQLLAPANAAGNTDTGPLFVWSAAQYADTYTLAVDDNPDFSSPVINLSTAATSYDAPGGTLLPQTYYFWRVTAYNSTGSMASTPENRLLLTSVPMPTTLYVDIDSTSPGIGSGWSNARTDLQFMVSVAAATNGAISEVRVGAGTYRPTGPGGNRSISFRLANGVTLRGGYAGVGTPNPDARDVSLYPAILSGDLNGNDGANFVNYGENSYHVVNATGVSPSAVIDGFTIRSGNANGSGANGESTGGGLETQAPTPGSPTVIACRFEANSATQAGAVHVGGGTATFTGCQFMGNRDTGSDGGAYFQSAGTINLTDCQFMNNTSGHSGGAMGVLGGSLTLVNVDFTSNTAAGDGGAITMPTSGSLTCTDCTFTSNAAPAGNADGGAVRWGSTNGTLTMTGCEFTGNSSGFRGGALSCTTGSGAINLDACDFVNNTVGVVGAGLSMIGGSSGTITECEFTDNTSNVNAGGAYVQNSTNIVFSLCVFTENDSLATNVAAKDGGGAAFINNGSPDFNDCTFTANTAVVNGGAVNVYNNASPDFRRCTFVNNTATRGGGAVFSFSSCHPAFIQCRFTANSSSLGAGGAIYSLQNSPCTAISSRFDGNAAPTEVGGAILLYGNCPGTFTNCVFNKSLCGDRGGAVACHDNADAVFTNCTIAFNTAVGNGGGVSADTNGSSNTLRNCIAWGNVANGGTNTSESAQVYSGSGGAASVADSAIQGWTGTLGGSNNSGVNPLFKDADGADNIPGNTDDDFRPTKRSLCIDLANDGLLSSDPYDLDGDTNTAEPWPVDINGSARFVDCLDIGAAEYDGLDPTLLNVGCDGSTSGACFSGIGDLPEGVFESIARGVSADGRFVAGRSKVGTLQAQTYEATVRTVSGLAGLGMFTAPGALSESQDISGDGRTIVGASAVSGGAVAFRWTDCEGLVSLGDLPGGILNAAALGASHDGSVVVGNASSSTGFEAFRWTAGGGMVGLGDLPGGIVESFGWDVSSDGIVVVGWSAATLGNEAYRWTQGGGMVSLGQLPGGTHLSYAIATNVDGSVIVGGTSTANGPEAFRWTSATSTMTALGDLPGGSFGSEALDVSADGNVIVGMSYGESAETAFYWTQSRGMMDLRQLLIDEYGLGPQLTGWDLMFARAVSADGLTIVGEGVNPNSQQEGWIVHLPHLPEVACPADIAPPPSGNGLVNVQDLLAVIGAWGACANPTPPNCPADIAPPGGDDLVNVQDLLAVIGAWGACP